MIAMIFAMLVGHAVCDYPLQGDFLARGKNHRAPLPGVPWQIILTAHALIHAGAVGLITGSMWLAVAELAWHFIIDFSKSEGWFGDGARAFTTDQALHVVCKIAWAAIVIYG
jgi:hypothetical protein